MRRRRRGRGRAAARAVLFLSSALVAGAFAGPAAACVCVKTPLEDRLDQADAAIVGRIVSQSERTVGGARQALLTVEVDQRVKGDVGDEIVVRSPLGTDCDLASPRSTEAEATGLLLARAPDGAWLGSACSIVDAAALVTVGGETRGGAIKVVVGLAILGLVLLWAYRRLRRGRRPELPGAPGP